MDPPLPSAGRMLLNAGGALARTVAAVARGAAVMVPDDVQRERIEICGACEFQRADGRCSKCGCYVTSAVLRKTAVATERCPIGKWERWTAPAT